MDAGRRSPAWSSKIDVVNPGGVRAAIVVVNAGAAVITGSVIERIRASARFRGTASGPRQRNCVICCRHVV